jgi:adenylylsulfate kinase
MSGATARQIMDDGPKTAGRGAAIWFTGIPGSGKSSVARLVRDALLAEGREAVHLEMDARRKTYFPKPKYTREEREEAYRLFAGEAAEMAALGKIVIMDGSAYKLAMRQYARGLIGKFAEVRVKCSVATAMKREAARPEGQVMAGLYAKAIKRKATGEEFEGLGEVIGVDVAFEENPAAEVTVDSERLSPKEAANRALAFIRPWLSSPVSL